MPGPFYVFYMDVILFINWNVNPEIFHIGPLSIRWYGLLFATSFYIGYYLLSKFFTKEGFSIEKVDALVIYGILGVVLGARLGHVIFYDLDYYLQNPVEILQIWKGGLASHGAALGMLLSLYLYHRKYPEIDYLWLLDRISIPVAIGGALVRIGNLFNSEIVGKPTDLPWGFVFIRNGEDFPRHPTQIYEALAYFAIFVFLYYTYTKKYNYKPPKGLIIGYFLVFTFSARFIIEFIKEVQSPFENNLPLDMGQILSIPLVLLGLFLIFRAKKQNLAAA